jgi:predicted methyltransferase
MRTTSAFVSLAALALAGCATTMAEAPATHVSTLEAADAAIADPARPDTAKALDASRKPAETLAFLGLQPGMHAADVMTGSGYWAEIMAHVVGPTGSVAAFEPRQFVDPAKGTPELDGVKARNGNVTTTLYPFEAFAPAANTLDFTIINMSYHDLYWESAKYHVPRTDPQAFVRALYAATKPGGIVGIVDHVGPAGDTRAVVEKLHRIDPATVKADFERAGFRLEAQSDLLANPADDHALNVFDKAIRGKTDRFVYKFRKPRR